MSAPRLRRWVDNHRRGLAVYLYLLVGGLWVTASRVVVEFGWAVGIVVFVLGGIAHVWGDHNLTRYVHTVKIVAALKASPGIRVVTTRTLDGDGRLISEEEETTWQAGA